MRINQGFKNMAQNYLFAEVAARTQAYVAAHPEKKVLRMGIGDVAGPLSVFVTQAMHAAAEEFSRQESFRGYGPYEGYAFLRETVSDYYKRMGVDVAADEVYVNDGAKSDTGNIGDLFAPDNLALIPDPVYPVYVDANTMAGRPIAYMNGTPENGFLPLPDKDTKGDIVYLCSPNNPTGAVYDKAGLRLWVDWANKNGAVILFDAAYESFVTDPSLPRSIFAIEGARTCAIEFCSLSKTAGFTGTRCGYTVIPKELERDGQKLGTLWLRRQATKFNGVPYIVQRGAQAALSVEGMAQNAEAIAYYKENARIIGAAVGSFTTYVGGAHSPYIWMKCPDGKRSWEYFDELLTQKQIVGTPGAGFGTNGEGYMRLTAFGRREDVREAMDRLCE